ncbi:MAG: hypothetical protein U0Q18_19970 [Bryobacteraceae bacterium]
MANSSQQTILDFFHGVTGRQSDGTDVSSVMPTPAAASEQGLSSALLQATEQITAQTQATSANTAALGQNTETKSRGGSGTSDVLNTVTQFLGGGLALTPIFSLFSSLFGGSDTQASTTLPSYSLPPALHLSLTNSGGDLVYGENGLPRAAGAPSTQPSSAPQITVQVNAMDSKSFLDHSDEIAQAVRKAMLGMNSINDVVADL